MLSKKIGIDLGTCTVQVFVQGEGIVFNQPSVVATNSDRSRILAVGQEAYDMMGRTPENVHAVRPMREGVIADFVVTEGMLHYFIRRVHGRQRLFKPDLMVAVPSGVTGVERRAMVEAALQAGARQAWLIEEPLAAAIGANLPVGTPSGSAVCDIGGGTTEMAIISLDGIVTSSSVRVGGIKMDEAIAAYVRKRHNLLIGERTAEEVKIQIGSALPLNDNPIVSVRGRDMVAGLPKNEKISADEVMEAIQDQLAAILGCVRTALEQTPPELAADIYDKGLVLTGGGAMLRNLDRFLSISTGIPTIVADEPQTCVVKGTGLALEHSEVFKRGPLRLN